MDFSDNEQNFFGIKTHNEFKEKSKQFSKKEENLESLNDQNKKKSKKESKTDFVKKENFFTNYAFKNNFFRSKVFKIGFFSVLMTILSFFIILEISKMTSIVFYNLVETQSGDSELLLTKDVNTEKIETIFDYDEAEKQKEHFSQQYGLDLSERTDILKRDILNDEEKQELIRRSMTGDFESLQHLINSQNISFVEFLEIFPNLIKNYGLMDPVKIKESIFKNMYLDQYHQIFENKNDEKDQIKTSLNNVFESNLESAQKRILQDLPTFEDFMNYINEQGIDPLTFADETQEEIMKQFQEFINSLNLSPDQLQQINPNDFFAFPDNIENPFQDLLSNENDNSSNNEFMSENINLNEDLEYTYQNPSLGFKLSDVPNLKFGFDRLDLVGVTGRWIIPVNVTNPDKVIETNNDSFDLNNLQVNLLLTDIANEIKSGIGRNSDMKNSFENFHFKNSSEKENFFNDHVIMSDIIQRYLSSDENIKIKLSFDYFFNKIGIDNFQIEKILNLSDFINYFAQIKYNPRTKKFFKDISMNVEPNAILKPFNLDLIISQMNIILLRIISISQSIKNGEPIENISLLDGLPIPTELFTSVFPGPNDIYQFIENFWNEQYINFLDNIGELIIDTINNFTNLELSYKIGGTLKSTQGLYNGLLGNVIFVDKKGISSKIVKNLQSQVNNIKNSLDNVFRNFNIPFFFVSDFFDPVIQDYLNDFNDGIEFFFEGNKRKILFKREPKSENEKKNLEALRKSDFPGIFSFYPLLQIYSPNKDFLYQDLTIFKEKSELFSDRLSIHIENHFSFNYLNPLKETLVFMNNLHIFLKVLIINIIIVLGIINLIIIYSLTSLAVNDKNFEFGIVRSMGLKKTGILLLICTFIAIVSGLFISSLLKFIILMAINVEYEYSFSKSHIIFCSLVGIIVPIFSALLAYTLTLLGRIIEALSTLKLPSSTFKKSFQNLLTIRFSTGQLVLSCLFLFYGLTFFYFVPKSFFYFDVFTFILLMSFIILLMFVGVSLLTTYLQIYLQIFWSELFFCIFKSSRKLKRLVLRNIKSNRNKNAQIFMLLSLVMIFMVFSDSSFASQLGSAYKIIFIRTGADIRLSSLGKLDSLKKNRLEREIKKFNLKYTENKEVPILQYSFNCKSLKNNPNVRMISLSNNIKFPVKRNINLKCIDENFADSIESSFYKPHKFVDGEKDDYFKQTGEKHGINSIFQDLLITQDEYDRNNIIYGTVPYLTDYFGFKNENQEKENENEIEQEEENTDNNTLSPNESNNETDSQNSAQTNYEYNLNTSFFNELSEEMPLLVPEGMLKILAMEAGDKGILTIQTKQGYIYEFHIRISHTAKTIPGTIFSSYSSRNRIFHDMFISMENYQFILNMIMDPHYSSSLKNYKVKISPPVDLNLPEHKARYQQKIENSVVDPYKLSQDTNKVLYSVDESRNDDELKLDQFPNIEIKANQYMKNSHLATYLERYYFTAISTNPVSFDKDGKWRNYKLYETLTPPIESLYLKINKNLDDDKMNELEKNLLSIESTQDVSLNNMKNLKRDLDKAEVYLKLFNYFILLLLFVLAFFLLLVFFLNMIRERRWEFAVLRAIGFRYSDIRAVYLLEIASNVLSALLLGAVVGFLFSSLSTYQFSSFNEIRLKYLFNI